MAEIIRQNFNPDRQSQQAAEGRVPPQAVDVEMSVLGAMLIEREAVSKALEILDEDSFYRDAHRKIFQAMVALFEKSEPVDLVTLTEELRRRGELDTIGGPVYLTDLTSRITSAGNIEYHARIVLEKALLRSLINASSEVVNRAYNESEDALDLLDDAEQKIFQISERRLKKSFTLINTAIHDTMEMLESIHGRHSGVTGVPSGFTQLDNLTGGFQPSDLVIIAGRPSIGKTALAVSIARNAAVDHELPVGIFSLEMSNTQLVLRLICAESRVNAHSVRTGRLTNEEWQRLVNRIDKLVKARIFIDDTPSLGILELRAKARRLKAEHDIRLVVVDYLQLMQGPKNAESREREISAISRSLKALSKELRIPVIALSQLSRAVEARASKRPVLSDLRESGAIEQDADVVLFVHRPEVYGEELLEDGQTSAQGVAEVIVGKQRNGPTGQVQLAFIKEYARFENLAYPSFEELEPPVPPAGRLVPRAGLEEPPF
ncbi:MAG TPA: replicative DNA helicase [Bacteroidota bacterium]